MKKILFAFMTAAVMLTSCGSKDATEEKKVFNFAEEEAAYKKWVQEFMSKYRAVDANRDSLEKVYNDYTQALSEEHIGDSLGLMLTIDAAYEMNRHELDSAMNLCDLYKNSERLQKISSTLRAKDATSAGCQYVDFEGVDIKNGKNVKLSDILAKGKPVLVDFWASWCIPCRREIKEHLSVLAPEYKKNVNFVSVAVWEDTIANTQKAAADLKVDWQVLYAGSRENSPTEQYGILGIPQIILIGKDGIIQARDLRGADIKVAIDKALGKK